MVRTVTGALLVVVLLAGGTADGKDKKAGKAARNQMVKGTIKLVDVDKNLLVINQKVKGEVVPRELSITADTDFVIMNGSEKTVRAGKDGLILLQNQVGASVKVKCDKDVNVLEVTVKTKGKKK